MICFARESRKISSAIFFANASYAHVMKKFFIPPDLVTGPQIPQTDAVLVLDKPSGPSSAQCLSVFKRQGQKKIGHAGTLDPLASGVLIVLLGQATKLSPWLLRGGRKVYRGVLRLGLETDTWDIEGDTLARHDCASIATDDIAREIAAWPLLDTQTVPAYSAAKHNGQPLYKLARKGQDTPIKVKSVKIYEARMLDASMPFATFRVACGSGAYIRSLAHSLGVRLGCGAALQELTREYSHPFDLAAACPWQAALDGTWTRYAQPLPAALPDWAVVELNADWADKVRNGMPVPCLQGGQNAFLAHAGTPLALASRKDDRWIIERGLWNT